MVEKCSTIQMSLPPSALYVYAFFFLSYVPCQDKNHSETKLHAKLTLAEPFLDSKSHNRFTKCNIKLIPQLESHYKVKTDVTLPTCHFPII